MRAWHFVVVAAAAALWAWLAACTDGTNDLQTWQQFGAWVHERGLGFAYGNVESFNHPPVTGWLVGQLWGLTGTPDAFALWFRMASLVLALVTAGFVWRMHSAFAAVFMVASPLALAVGGYHGNTDLMLGCLVALSALAGQRQRWGLAGVLLGSAINIKLTPVVLVTWLLGAAPGGRARRQAFAGLAVAAVPFIAGALFFGLPFLRNVAAYTSQLDAWGLNEPVFLLERLGLQLRGDSLDRLHTFIRLELVIGLLIAGWWLRARLWSVTERYALALAVFLVVTPGFGIQYLAWLGPVLLVCWPLEGALYAVLGGAYAWLAYAGWSVAGAPRWHSIYGSQVPNEALGVAVWGLVAWVGLRLFRHAPPIR